MSQEQTILEQELFNLFSELFEINKKIQGLVQEKNFEEFNNGMTHRQKLSQKIIELCTETKNQELIESFSEPLKIKSQELLNSDEALIKKLELEIQKLHSKRERLLFQARIKK